MSLTFTAPLSRTKKTLQMMRDKKRRFSPAVKDEFDFEFLDEEEGDSDYWDQDETKNNDIDDDDSNTHYKKRMGKFRDAFIDAFDDETFEAKEEEEEVSLFTNTAETPINGRKCARSIAMKPSRRLYENDDKSSGSSSSHTKCGKRLTHEDFPPVAVVSAIHARSLMKIKSKSIDAMTEFTENLRMAFGDERDKKSEMHSDGELVLVVYGVNEETEEVLEDLEKHLFRENDFYLAIIDGDTRALNEISDYDDAIARGVKFTRAKFAIVADLNAIVPSAEWTKMALVKVFRTEPTVAAVLFGGNENVSGFEGAKRPAMVIRAWEAKFALTSEDGSSGCAKTEKSLMSVMVDKGMEFKRLPRKLKRIDKSSRSSIGSGNNRDSSSRNDGGNRRLLFEEEEEGIDIMDGKWEANSNRGGVDGAFDLGCKSASKRNEKSLFCPTSSNNDNINKRKRRVQATFIMQYFNRAKTLGEIFDALAKSVKHSSISSPSSFTMEVLANVDSGYKKSDNWVKHALEFKKQTGNHDSPFVLSFSNDIHELRAYNRLAHVATAELLVFAQDDDKPDVTDPSSLSWLLDGLSLMRRHKDLALLGAYRGRYDDGSRMKTSSNQNDGSKFGGNFESDRETRPIAYVDSELGVPFLWMYKVNMGPMLFRKSIFLASGGFHDQFSCAGEMAQGFDFEISVRMWSEGFKVGLYDPKWLHRIDKDLTAIGNQNRHRDVQKKELTDKKDEATKRNNQNIYTLFASEKNFHHEKGTKLAKKSLKEDLAKKNVNLRITENARVVPQLVFRHAERRGDVHVRRPEVFPTKVHRKAQRRGRERRRREEGVAERRERRHRRFQNSIHKRRESEIQIRVVRARRRAESLERSFGGDAKSRAEDGVVLIILKSFRRGCRKTMAERKRARDKRKSRTSALAARERSRTGIETRGRARRERFDLRHRRRRQRRRTGETRERGKICG